MKRNDNTPLKKLHLTFHPLYNPAFNLWCSSVGAPLLQFREGEKLQQAGGGIHEGRSRASSGDMKDEPEQRPQVFSVTVLYH